jgi:DMSO/TMAO reductase YedYZ molybdopterin-dependent catalytic subunit
MSTSSSPARSSSPRSAHFEKPRRVGRRVFLGIVALGAAGVAVGDRVQSFLGGVVGSGLGGILPGGDRFRLYTVTGSFPVIPRAKYRLQVTGLVERPLTLTVDDLEAMPSTKLVKDFQCVTGWRVPEVHWEGVKLSDVLDMAGVKAGATGLNFESYDGTDSESLTLDQARLPDVIVAYRMLGAPVTTEHGGPVRLYVAPMFGYKSLKWLSAVRVVAAPTPGFWEQNGYPVDGWIDGSTSPQIGNNNTTSVG